MKKKIIVFLLMLALALFAGCAAVSKIPFEQAVKSGEIGAFAQSGPAEGEVVPSASPTFSWSAAENAETYTLELFEDENCTQSCYRKTNISATSFRMQATLTLRRTYWWKVTAVNSDTEREADNAGSSFLCRLSAEDAQVDIDLGSAEDYTVNGDGMGIDVSLDGEDTLGTGNPTLKLSYGNNDIGWGVVSRVTGFSMWTGDAIKLTFLYTGGDCSFAIRFLEMDSDLWTCRVAAPQGKDTVQTLVIPYSAFSLREDESFGDHEIQFDLINRIDFVVESCYDAGAVYVGDITVVNYDDYKDEATDRIDLGETAQWSLNPGGYAAQVSVVSDGTFGDEPALRLVYGDDISSVGWTVATRQVGTDIVSGVDALYLDFLYSGYAANFAVRLQEADGDLWIASFSAGNLGTVQNIVIPFGSFALRTDESFGDGAVQMDRVNRIDLMAENAYGAGECMFSGIRFVKYSDYEEEETEMNFDGVFGDNMVLQRGKPVTVTGYGVAGTTYSLAFDGKTYEAKADDGGRWSVSLPAHDAGGNYELLLSDAAGNSVSLQNVTFGDVFLFAGQSNMMFRLGQSTDTKPDPENSDLRLFFQSENRADAPQDSPKGAYWAESSALTAPNASAIAWFVSQLVQAEQNVPVGVVTAAVGDTFIEHWMSADAYKGSREGASVLYNGMIAPLRSLEISGFIWYQGENNCGFYEEYGTLLGSFVDDIRDKFDYPDLPVFLVQLPGYTHDYNWAYIREVQETFCKTAENVHLVVTLDGGNASDIHPTEKLYIAERIADLIAQYVYGTGSGADMPVYEGYEISGSSVVLSFGNAQGLHLSGSGGFEIAGEDGVFFPAEAEVSDGKVILNCSSVPAPLYARYAFEGMPQATLFNGAGLPVGSFRTYTEDDPVALSWKQEKIDTQFHSGDNKGWTATAENGSLTVEYDNAAGNGWGIVRYAAGESLGSGEVLAFSFVQEGFAASFRIRVYEADGDGWQASIPSGVSAVYIPLSEFTRIEDSWGDGVADFGGVVTNIEIVTEQCYGEGVFTVSGLKTVGEEDVPQGDPMCMVSFAGEYIASRYMTQAQNADSVTLSHIGAEEQGNALAAPALRVGLQEVGGWANIFVSYTTGAYAGDAVTFDIAAGGDSVGTYNFVFVFDGYRQYMQNFSVGSGKTTVTLPLSGFVKKDAGDREFGENSLSSLTHIGISVSESYGNTEILLGEIRYTDDAPADIIVDDFESYDAAAWTGSHPDSADHPQMTLTSADGEKNGGAHGVSLRYVTSGNDTSYAKQLSVPASGTKFSVWLKGASTSTVFLQLYSGGVVYKVILSPSTTPVSEEGQVYTFDFSAFLRDGDGASLAGKEVEKVEFLIQDWTVPFGYAHLFADDITILQ